MSKLKEYKLKARDARELVINNHYWPNEESMSVYLKSEADTVIAELEENHKTEVKELLCLIRDKENNFNRAFDSEEKELRHHKYKRCLTMASSCSDKASAEYASSYVSCDEYYYHHAEFWVKWRKRWLELAEKFKPNKSTVEKTKDKT